MTQCPNCDRAGRTWVVAEDDRFCGLCGRPVRDVRLRPQDEAVRPERTGQVPTYHWMIGESEASRTLPLIVENAGTFPVDSIHLTVDPPAAGKITDGPPQPLDREGKRPAAFVLAKPAAASPQPVEVTVGVENFPKSRVRLRAVPAPRRFTARAMRNDLWSRITATQLGQVFEVVADRGADDKQLLWQTPKLTLLSWSTGDVELEVAPEAGAGVLPAAAGPASAAWEGASELRVTRPDNGRPQYPMQFLIQGPAREDYEGTLSVQLDALGGPRVRVPVRVVQGRPEWVCRVPAADVTQLQLPAGCYSSLRVRFDRIMAGEKKLEDRVRRRELRVTLSDPQIRCRAVLVSEGASEIDYRLRLWTPARQQKVDLDLQLVAVLENQEAVISRPRRLTLDIQEAGELNSGQRIVVDFGTTNTCVARCDAGAASKHCLKFPSLVRTDREPDMIPTLLWVRSADDAADPECLIGEPARQRGRTGTEPGRLFREFKPAVGLKGPPYTVDSPKGGGKPAEYTATDLAKLFLRELLLEIRAGIDNQVIESLEITYPSTFTFEQRQALQQVLRELKQDCGIAGEVSVLIDEATAGAFKDLLAHLVKLNDGRPGDLPERLGVVLYDIGGGTVDVALLSAERRPDAEPQEFEEDTPAYDLLPRGVTGLRDFAGKNITLAIRQLLEERLWEALYKGKKMFVGENGWVPLPMLMLKAAHSPAVVAAARHNDAFLHEVAEKIKTDLYGRAAGVDERTLKTRPASEWYPKLPQDIAPLAAELLLTQDRQLHEFELLQVASVADEKITPVPAEQWAKWIGGLPLTRQHIDDYIDPALRESFERARLMLESVHPDRTYVPPTRLLLAGGSSNLPIIRKMAEEVLDVAPAHIEFSEYTAKRKVVLGAAFYSHAHRQPAFVQIVPHDPKDFVLLPIVYEMGGMAFRTIFPAGFRVAGPASAVTKAYGRLERLTLQLYEDIDYRTGEKWVPTEQMQRLGMQAAGKEPLTRFQIAFGPGADSSRVVHWLEHTPDGLRKMWVQYARKDRPQPVTEPRDI